MRLRSLAPLALLLATVPVWATAPPVRAKSAPGLVVEGETLVVVTRLPFDVVAPAGAKLYFWTLPPGWKGDVGVVSVANRVKVTAAPAGTAEVRVVVIDKDFVPTEYNLAVNVGKVPAPPPPPPPPDDPLLRAVQAAYAAETDAQKGTHAKALAALYRTWAKAVLDTPPASWSALFAAMSASSKTLGLSDKVVGVRRALATEFQRVLPPYDSPLPLGPDGAALASATFLRAALCLEALR